MELTAKVQHGAGWEAVDRQGEVERSFPAGVRRPRAFAKYVGLRPERVTYRTRTYLWVVGLSGYRLVLPVPAQIPECTEALDLLPQQNPGFHSAAPNDW